MGLLKLKIKLRVVQIYQYCPIETQSQGVWRLEDKIGTAQ